MTLIDPVEPLTSRQRGAVVLTTLCIAAARALTMAASPWDWDEIQMLLGLRDYDVLFHRPHPPGFPLYIGAGKLLELAGFSDFGALQALNFLAGAALFPLAVFTFREMRFPIRTAVSAAAILVFFPNVWFFGGTAFSDVPSLALILAAVGLLFRGCRSTGAYIAGAIILGVAAGVRPQGLLIGALPFLIATWSWIRAGRWQPVAAGVLGGGAVVAGAYGAAIWATGWGRYFDALRAHQEFIATFDTGRVALRTVFDDFFVRPYRAPLINAAVTILALIGLLKRSTPVLLALGTFGPFAIAAWLFLDPLSASRFSIAYAPLIAAAAAEGIAAIAGERRVLHYVVATALIVTMIVWTLPAAMHARAHESPPAQAMRWIAAHADPRTTLIYVHETVLPFASYYLPQFDRRNAHDAAPPRIRAQRAYFVTEGQRADSVKTFVWPKARLWDLVRPRYFIVSISPTSSRIEFGSGWYEEESNDGSAWRWMGRRSVTHIGGQAGRGRLRIHFEMPEELLPRSPEVIVRWNGAEIDRFRPRQRSIDRTYRPVGPGELVLETTEVMNLAREGRGEDTRDLGLMLRGIEWIPETP